MKHRIIAAAVLAAVLCLALLAACGSGEPTRKDYEAIKEGTPGSDTATVSKVTITKRQSPNG